MENQLFVRLAEKDDLPRIEQVIAQARARIGALGIDQWQDGSPSMATVEKDLEKRQGYALVLGDTVCGYFALLTEEEPAYDQIAETWEGAKENSVTIHRVAVCDDVQGKGMGRAMMLEAEVIAKAFDRRFIRIDTHEGNRVMRAFLAKLGYVYRGEVFYADIVSPTKTRLCFEKKL